MSSVAVFGATAGPGGDESDFAVSRAFLPLFFRSEVDAVKGLRFMELVRSLAC